MKRFIVPAVFVAVVVLAVVGVWFALRPPTGHANGPTTNERPTQRSPANDGAPAQEQYNPAVVSPDPVIKDTPPPFRQPDATTRLELTGRVLREGGVAVPDAEVRFVGEGPLREAAGIAHTDASGRYRLVTFAGRGAIAGGKGRMLATTADGSRGLSAQADIGTDVPFAMPDVMITPGGTIRGRVLDDAGAAGAGVTVMLRSTAPREGLAPGTRGNYVQHVFETAAATTDTRGDYTFKGLPPGRYHLDADRSWHGIKKETVEVEVAAGGLAIADLYVTARNFIRGVVRDALGQPVQGALVRASGGALDTGDLKINDTREGFRRSGDRPGLITEGDFAPGSLKCVTDMQGRFGWFALRPGNWQVSTMAGGAHTKLENVPLDGPDVELRVDAGASVSGTVRSAEGGAVEFFDARIVHGAETATPFDRVSDDRGFPLRPTGEFRLLNPGKGTRVRFSAPGFLPASLAIPELQPGETRKGLEVTLEPLCDLTLTLSQAGERQAVEPVMLLFDGNLVAQSTTDESGRARLWKVPPAAYTVLVIQRDGTKLEAALTVPGRARAALELELVPAKK